MAAPTTYRGCTISANWTSINGTGARLKSPRGWNVTLPGDGSLGWSSSLADARATVDQARAEGPPPVLRAFAAIDAREAA